jgi:hypothetical protein
MIAKLFDILFGCWHSRYSFPMTVRPGSRRNNAAAVTGTYVVCLDCGLELPYDWREMRIVSSTSDNRTAVKALATKEAASILR